SVIAALIVLLRSDLNLTAFEGNYGLLLKAYLAAAFPFFFGGLCISLALTHYSDIVSRIYFFDLAGASMGCLLVIPALNFLGGPTAMLALTLPMLVAAILFSTNGERRTVSEKEFKAGESVETTPSVSPLVARLTSFMTTLAAALLIVFCVLIAYDYKTQAFA